jgi:mevalonate kinase
MQGSAPAKVILFGEHAVVYGQPAIAAPVSSLRATVTAEMTRHGGLVIRSPHTGHIFQFGLDDRPADENSLVLAARLACDALEISQTPNLILTLNSDIPIGHGLGSGAAVCTALVRAICAAHERTLPDERLNDLIYEVEKKHHGTPSGIDNTVIVYEQPVYFVRGQPIEHLDIGGAFTLLVADSGYGTPTHITVGDVRRHYESDRPRLAPMFERIGEITRAARQAIEGGDAASLGTLMNANHELLQRLTVSSIELDLLVESAIDAGALGAKMSGGGRGGNIIALVTESHTRQVIAALHSAGAARVVKTRLSVYS